MLEYIEKYDNGTTDDYLFSILLPTWNNLPYLQNCVSAIREHAAFPHQIIVIINEGNDGTLEWVRQENLDFVYAQKNIGICYGLNIARALVKAKYILYINDDMYVLPGWDSVLKENIERIGHHNFYLSATMIEPTDTGNACVVVQDFGRDISDFKKDSLLRTYKNLQREDWNGATWPPSVMHIDLWDLVGGMSVEYSPGMYSDPDMAKKLYDAGVRTFKGCGAALVYHFGSKSTKKVRKNKGRKMFLSKWGFTAGYFYKNILKMGAPFQVLEENFEKKDSIINTFKRVKNQL